MISSKGQRKGQNLYDKSDEELVALFMDKNTADMERERIRGELQRRYYPFHNPKQKGVPQQGFKFTKLVYAILRRYGVDNGQLSECCEKCCEVIFHRFFLSNRGFDDLLEKFDPARGSFSNWVLYVRVRSAIVDWLREGNCTPSKEVVWQPGLGGSTDANQSRKPKRHLWWDNLLCPKHGVVIFLLHLAYRNINDGYLGCIVRETAKSQKEVSQELTHLQQCLRPDRYFGHGESAQIYALEKILESDQFKAFRPQRRLTEADWQTIIEEAAANAKGNFRTGKSAIEPGVLQAMIWAAFAGPPVVDNLRQVLRRWIRYLKGDLVEGKLQALTQEIERWQKRMQWHQDELHRAGLSEDDIDRLQQATDALTLQRLKVMQNQAGDKDDLKRQTLLFQEGIIRLNKAKHKRDQILTHHYDGKYLAKPLQREIAAVLGTGMGTVAGRIAQAKRALVGATIWWRILKRLENLDVIIRAQHRLERLQMTRVWSLKSGVLTIGVPDPKAVRWWQVFLPCVALVLDQFSVSKVMERFRQKKLRVQYRVEWNDCQDVDDANREEVQ